MTLPYKRNFGIGRQSEQFFNDKLHLIYQALREINYRKNENKGQEPDATVDGALWFDKVDNLLKYYDMRTLSWKTIFSQKFQITDQILNITTPANPVVGQLWIFNGVLMYFDGATWQPIKAMIQDESQWSNSTFEDFIIVTPLNPSPNAIVDGEESGIKLSEFVKQNDDNHHNTNVITPKDAKWGSNEWEKEDGESLYPTVNKVPEDNLKSQFLVPNLNVDRLFLDDLNDKTYEEVSKVCIQYPTKDVYDKTVSCIHLNPGKLVKMTKRFVKVDKLNSTINIPAYNTEFYGYRNGEYGGHFLIESKNQDKGDYIPSGDYILLNYEANQNYDYVLAITYEFSSLNATGFLDHWTSDNPKRSFYLANLKEPINVHTNGLKLEEAVYDVNYRQKTVTINDENIDNVTVQMWSPYKKQFGYIRETDLEGNGLIRLHGKVNIPLVFVGGTLIHPIFGGLKFEGDTIIVPNNFGPDSMKNLAWCVVDLKSESNEDMYFEQGTVEEVGQEFVTDEKDCLDGQDNYIIHGNLQDTIDTEGFRDYILAAGVLSSDYGNLLYYDNRKIGKDDGIILFVNGFMINEKDIIRNHASGFIRLIPELEIGQEYVLIRDNDKRLYTESMLQSAFATGYFDESLIYLNGQLLVNSGCLATIYDEEHVMVEEDIVDNEIKYFVSAEDEIKGTWKIYNEYEYRWDEIEDKELANIELIGSSYSNQLTSIKINIETTPEDDLSVYTFKFSNSVSGIYKYGEARFLEIDPEDNLQIWAIGNDPYAYRQGVLNIFKNGIKLIANVDYKELSENNYIKMLNPDIKIDDKITYFIEPIEAGEQYGYETVLLTKEDSIQPNVYAVEENDSTPSLYPGRLTVYVNGLRIPKESWTLLDSKKIMLKFEDYKTLGTADNFPIENKIRPDNSLISVTHNYPDYITVEIRKDYDRKEMTIELDSKDAMEIYVEDYGIPLGILECKDEILFYLNGQYLNMSRSMSNDYRLDVHKGCIVILNNKIIEALQSDPLLSIFNSNALAYSSWKARNKKDKYESNKRNILTLVWR